jgi:hypothetical protein
MFRRVDLPTRVPGRLLLHSMPGHFEAIERGLASGEEAKRSGRSYDGDVKINEPKGLVRPIFLT